MTASKVLFYFCLSFISGIFLSSILEISQLTILGLLILGVFLISVFWKYKKPVTVGFCLLILITGVWRYQQAELKIINDELRQFNDSEQDITLIGVVAREPDIREKSIKLTIEVEEISSEQDSQEIKGRVLVTIWRYPEYQYGDRLKITGKLETPKEFPDFNYKDYLSKDGIYSLIYFPKIELLENEIDGGPTSIIYGKVLEIKQKLRESIEQNLSPPQSSILGAMILGDKKQLSEDLKEKLNIAGVRHITAISGMHVAILTAILMTVLIGFGLWRRQAFYLTIILIFFFILMTGFQPSAIRAGIMGFLFLLGQHLGRLSVSSRAVVWAGALMLIQNPLLLRLDVGFQLSFLAIMGIIYLMPIFQYYFLKWFPVEWFQKRWWLSWFPIKFLGGLLAMTLSAQIFTLPILIYNFGYMSSVAPISNILVVPLLPFIMGLGFIFGILGILWQPLGWLLSLPCWLLLTYLTKIIDIFSKIPFAAPTFKISWVWLIIFYLVLGYFTWRLNEKQKLKFLNY